MKIDYRYMLSKTKSVHKYYVNYLKKQTILHNLNAEYIIGNSYFAEKIQYPLTFNRPIVNCVRLIIIESELVYRYKYFDMFFLVFLLVALL